MATGLASPYGIYRFAFRYFAGHDPVGRQFRFFFGRTAVGFGNSGHHANRHFPIVLSKHFGGKPSVAIQVALLSSALSIVLTPLLLSMALKLFVTS